jgi:hypothetical protein
MRRRSRPSSGRNLSISVACAHQFQIFWIGARTHRRNERQEIQQLLKRSSHDCMASGSRSFSSTTGPIERIHFDNLASAVSATMSQQKIIIRSMNTLRAAATALQGSNTPVPFKELRHDFRDGAAKPVSIWLRGWDDESAIGFATAVAAPKNESDRASKLRRKDFVGDSIIWEAADEKNFWRDRRVELGHRIDGRPEQAGVSASHHQQFPFTVHDHSGRAWIPDLWGVDMVATRSPAPSALLSAMGPLFWRMARTLHKDGILARKIALGIPGLINPMLPAPNEYEAIKFQAMQIVQRNS